jgi:hypothetical protein
VEGRGKNSTNFHCFIKKALMENRLTEVVHCGVQLFRKPP